MPPAAPRIYSFDGFALDEAGHTLARDDREITLRPKTFALLVYLVEHAGRMVTKDELLKSVWAGTFVSEATLTHTIWELRQHLGDETRHPRYIETIPKVGYRFNCSVESTPRRNGERQGASLQRRRRWLWVTTAATVAVVALSLVRFSGRPPDGKETEPPLRFRMLTSYPGIELSPTFSPDGIRVAFVWNGEGQGNFDIFVKSIDSEKSLRLTTDPALDLAPSWSPRGNLIAFLRYTPETATARVHIVDPLGGAARPIAEISASGSLPASFLSSELFEFAWAHLDWSGDGRHIIVRDRLGPEDPRFGLFLLPIEGGERLPLTEPPPGHWSDHHPVNSADGSGLLFVRSRNGCRGDLHLLPLTEEGRPAGPAKRVTEMDLPLAHPAWANQEEVVVSRGGLEHAELVKISLAGTQPPKPWILWGGGLMEPAISQSGRRLAFSWVQENCDIYAMQRTEGGAGREPRKLIASSRGDHSPEFAPDGERIVFISERSGYPEIWVADRQGEGARPLTSFEGPLLSAPRWSGDGQHIAFEYNDGQGDIYVADSGSGSARALTGGPSNDSRPFWSSDGAWIHFQSTRGGRRAHWRVPAEGGEPLEETDVSGVIRAVRPGESGEFFFVSDETLYQIAGRRRKRLLTNVHRILRVAGRKVYYLAEDGVAQSVGVFDLASAQTKLLFALDLPGYRPAAISPGGETLLLTHLEDSQSDLILVENFQ